METDMAVSQTPPELVDAEQALAQRDDAVLSQEIDAIIARLDEGIPKLQARMDEIRASLRRPITL
jgi:hypothetical protein